MAKYNIHWDEMCNLAIEAKSEKEAEEFWTMQAYDEDEVSRDCIDQPTITVLG